MLDRLKSLLQDPPPGMAFEISEAGIAAARIGSRAELEFQPLKPGTLSVSPIQENVADPEEFARAVRALAGTQAARKRKDVALILPDFSARLAVLDFDSFPSEPKEQLALVRFRLKRSVPFDVESAAMSYWAQAGADKRVDVVVVVTPLEIVARYEAPFRAAGMNPGAGDHVLPGGPGTGPGKRAHGGRQTDRARAHGAGARQGRAQAGALPGAAVGRAGGRRGGAGAHLRVRGGQPGRARRRSWRCAGSARARTRPRGALPKNWAWKWSRCGRRWERPERITPDCWGICGPSPGTTEMDSIIPPRQRKTMARPTET